MSDLERLEAEKARLKRQLDKVLEAIDNEAVDAPCPSTVGLKDSEWVPCLSQCGTCWRKALEEVS